MLPTLLPLASHINIQLQFQLIQDLKQRNRIYICVDLSLLSTHWSWLVDNWEKLHCIVYLHAFALDLQYNLKHCDLISCIILCRMHAWTFHLSTEGCRLHRWGVKKIVSTVWMNFWKIKTIQEAKTKCSLMTRLCQLSLALAVWWCSLDNIWYGVGLWSRATLRGGDKKNLNKRIVHRVNKMKTNIQQTKQPMRVIPIGLKGL